MRRKPEQLPLLALGGPSRPNFCTMKLFWMRLSAAHWPRRCSVQRDCPWRKADVAIRAHMEGFVRNPDKLRRLTSTLLRLAEAFELVGDPHLTEIATAWRNVLPKYDVLLAEGVPVSSLTAGLVQGLSEVPAIVGSFEPEIKAIALDTYYSVVMREAPEFMKKLEATITRMLARGQIRTEHEYHLARAVIDASRVAGIIEQIALLPQAACARVSRELVEK